MFRFVLIGLGILTLPCLYLWLIRSRWFHRTVESFSKPVNPTDNEVLSDAKQKISEAQALADSKKIAVKNARKNAKEFEAELKEAGLNKRKNK